MAYVTSSKGNLFFLVAARARDCLPMDAASRREYRRADSIMVNLLNNIVQPRHPDRPLSICVSLSERDDSWCPTTAKVYHCRDRKIIFERFIHGENKKHAVRGLALAIRSAGS